MLRTSWALCLPSLVSPHSLAPPEPLQSVWLTSHSLVIWGRKQQLLWRREAAAAKAALKPSKGVKKSSAVVGQSQGRRRRTANHFQVHIDKHDLAALNPHKLKVAYSKFWQRNDGVSLHHLLQWFFKVLAYQLNIFIRKQTSVMWPEKLYRWIPERSFAHFCHKEQIKPCSRVLFIYTLHHTQPSAFISASC